MEGADDRLVLKTRMCGGKGEEWGQRSSSC